ncbi:MAG: hypothetical protein DVB22_002236 [Verrucomicrobia bacterium]|nr:MAG: hypothetical protein DVB22_002236 [Verrucomicrobiota bacterium]
MAELGGLVSGERLACLSESCGPLPDLGAAANAPRLGSVASSLPSGVYRSPRKVRLLRRAPPRLRPVAAGARASQAASPALAPLALRHRAQPAVVLEAPHASGTRRKRPVPLLQPPPHRPTPPRMSRASGPPWLPSGSGCFFDGCLPSVGSPPSARVTPHADAAHPPTHCLGCCAPFSRCARPPAAGCHSSGMGAETVGCQGMRLLGRAEHHADLHLGQHPAVETGAHRLPPCGNRAARPREGDKPWIRYS